MCGIAGFIDLNPNYNLSDILQRMNSVLAHRGPDDQGSLCLGNVALGHRRLSIVDLSTSARQPMTNEDGNRHLVCNGEVYNHLDIRNKLKGANHQFVSHSDSEAILHLIEEYGPSAISMLNGMFAFAWLDTKEKQLILCRDRLGIKPLYFWQNADSLIFSSEIKGILEHPRVTTELDEESYGEYLFNRYVGGRKTLFKGIQQVLPGTYIRVSYGNNHLAIEETPYWSPSFPSTSLKSVDAEELTAQLHRAVEMRLMSDVPLGTQLSGGLDSSVVTALAVQSKPDLHTFSIAFKGFAPEEHDNAVKVSTHLNTHHHTVWFDQQKFLNGLAYCTYINDDPLNHPNSVALFELCNYLKKHVTVVLTGEGADELFAGYSWHRRCWRIDRLQWLKHMLPIRALGKILSSNSDVSRKLQFLSFPQQTLARSSGRHVTSCDIQKILTGIHSTSTPKSYRENLPLPAEASALESCRYLDLLTYLVSVLQRQDRMSMAAGVESRVPFLDHSFVESSFSIPGRKLFVKGQGKAPLRHIGRSLLPSSVLERQKFGFRMPVAQWMRNENGFGALLKWLLDEPAKERGLWNTDNVKQMVGSHISGQNDFSEPLWELVAFEIWARIFLDGISHIEVQNQINATTCIIDK